MDRIMGLRTAARIELRNKPKNRTDAEHLRIVWCNFMDEFSTVEELQAWCAMSAVDRAIHTTMENDVYRLWSHGMPLQKIANKKQISLETVSQIVDRRLKRDGR